jgi:diguanylate cyclase (GGDEF)-like protein
MAGTIATPEPSTGTGHADAAVADLVRRGYVNGRAASLTGAAAELRDHLRGGGLEVHYQPIVALPDRWLVGFEALARIRTPTGRLLQPSSFIALAETSGLIVPLGLEVLATAVSDLSRWRGDPALVGASVSVNVSPAQLGDDTFATSVRRVLHAHGLPAAAVVLEITESRLAGPDAQRTVALVEATGVRLALDDLGTGFATLDRLRRLPVHMVKLDRSFVEGIGHGGLDTVIVRNVLDLAYELDLTVVAEGVETHEQAASLVAWGCTSAQGILFGRPTPADQVAVRSPGPDPVPSLPRPSAIDRPDRATAVAIARTLSLGDADPHHRAHVHTVATGIGKAMRLPASTVHEIELAALCHDVARLGPLVRDPGGEVTLPRALRALLDPQAGPADQRITAQLVRIAVEVVADATGEPDAGPDPRRLAAALAANAATRPQGIARAMRQLAERLPSTAPTAADLLQAESARGDLRSTGDRLRALRALSQAVNPSADSRNLVGLLADEALGIVGAASLSLSRWERDEGVLRVLVNVGQLAEAKERFPDDETYAMTEYVAASRMLAAGVPHVQRVDDGQGDAGSRELLRRLGKGSSAAVPVYTDDHLWGELYVATGIDEPPFAARDLELLTAIADILGGALAYGEQLERMARLAFEDPLTGLSNRRAIDDRLEQALQETTEPVTVVMIDVNGLKQVNDEYGHATGDKALRAVADALSGATLDLPGATCARLGGDEFCVVLAGDDGRGVAPIVDRAAAQLRAAPAPQVTISAGAATSTFAGHTVRELFAAADRAQYQAKRTGRTLLLAGSTEDVGAGAIPVGRERPGPHRADMSGTTFEIACGRVIGVLGRLASAPADDVLEAVGTVMAETCDLGRWLLSRIDSDGVIRIQHLHLRRTRPATHHGSVVPPEDEVYHLDDYPVTRAAVEGPEPYWVRVDDPDHDAAERAVLTDIGMTAVLGIGAPDHDDGAWLLELYADEHTDDLATFAPLARVVALALHTRDGATPTG